MCHPKLSASVQAGLSFGLEFRLDVHKSIVLSYSLPTARRARLQVPGSKTHNDICNEVIRGFTRPVRYKNTPAKTVSQVCTR